MVQSYNFDEYGWTPPAVPEKPHRDWDWIGYEDFDRCADVSDEESPDAEGDSEYEKYRRRRIAANNAFLEGLGLGAGAGKGAGGRRAGGECSAGNAGGGKGQGHKKQGTKATVPAPAPRGRRRRRRRW